MVKLKIHIVNLKGNGFHPLIELQVNGIYIPVIIDTGASQTVFDFDWINKHCMEMLLTQADNGMGLGEEEFNTWNGLIDKFKIGDITIRNYKCTVIDLWHINQMYEKLGLSKVVAILGSDIMLHFNCEISYKERTIIFYEL
jgi:predicted aspartyl protease